MKRALVLASLALVAACGGAPAKIETSARGGDLPSAFVLAMREEATKDPARAETLYLDAIDAAVAEPKNPYALATVAASLDALVARHPLGLVEVGTDTALAFRTREVALGAIHQKLPFRLSDAWKNAEDPFVRALLARALQRLAEHRGDAKDAATWRAATGCAREAAMVGPTSWAPITGLSDPDPLEHADAQLPAKTALPGPFVAEVPTTTMHDRGCALDLGAASAFRGVRDVVVDVSVPKTQTIAVGLWSTAPALLRVGGRVVLERPYELGGTSVARFAKVTVQPGTVRVVVRVGMDAEGDHVQLGLWDEKGKPLAARAPKSGEAANAAAISSRAVEPPAAKTDAEKTLLGAAALALGDGRTAERALAKDAARAGASPEIPLVYARAVETALDLTAVHRAERARGAYEKVLEAWPHAWEAALAHAVLAGVRRAQNEQRIESLLDLDKRRKGAPAPVAALYDAFDAALSGREGLYDRAKASLERAKGALEGTTLFFEAGRWAVPRTSLDQASYLCADKYTPPANFDCRDALYQAGRRDAAEVELQRVKNVLGAPDLYLSVSLRDALTDGDAAKATRLYERMLPGERTLTMMFATTLPKDARALFAAAPLARDAPHVLPSLLRIAGDAPLAAFDGVSEKLWDEDRKSPILPSAPTAILKHTERYDLLPSGLLHFVMYDLRRVSGTTDVEENAQAIPPAISGRDVTRVLRRRIFKKDGRILSPEQTPHAAQSHADLSQLEQGDAVEAIYEGWGLPGDTGHIGLDTPDMLSDRTAVHSASIELHLPAGLKGSLFAHPLLGKAEERSKGSERVLAWSMTDAPVRRIEDGVPKMDRNVSVSFGTAEWKDVGRALRETVAALDEHDPEIGDFAREAAKAAKEPGPEHVVLAVVEASGNVVKEASPGALLDLDSGGSNGPQQMTARSIVTASEGSRVWVIARALRELGIKTDVVVAENEPFSMDPSYPPHFGRFMHPLAVAHVAANKDIWIDADVQGPPLPAGRISPELRGRSAINAEGAIVPLPTTAGASERDEVDIRLALAPSGDAKGSVTVLLRGRAAQELAEALVRIVGAERQKALRAVALAWVPYANVDDVQLSSSEGSWQVALRAEVTIPGYAQIEGRGKTQTWVLPGIEPIHVMFPRPFVTTLGATYASRSARENALAISHALQYHVHRRVELPQGAEVQRMPGPFDAKNTTLEASRKMGVNGKTIEEEFVLGVATGTIPADRYGAFVADAHKTDDAFLASTRVRPAGP